MKLTYKGMATYRAPYLIGDAPVQVWEGPEGNAYVVKTDSGEILTERRLLNSEGLGEVRNEPPKLRLVIVPVVPSGKILAPHILIMINGGLYLAPVIGEPTKIESVEAGNDGAY